MEDQMGVQRPQLYLSGILDKFKSLVLLFSFIPCRRKDEEDTNVFTLSRVIDPFGDLKAVNFLERKKYPCLA